jgi:hypothetical protein
VNQCPTCGQQFLQARCWMLENIVQKIKYRCQYYKEGCQLISSSHFIKFHEVDCPYRPFNCPFSFVVTKNVCWRGQMRDMWDHIRYNHVAHTFPGEGKFVFTVDCAGPGALHRALYANDEIFLVVCRVINMDLYCCVLYVGPQKWASWYNYCVTIKESYGREYATVCLPTESYFVNVETLFRNRDCAVFAYVLWNRCCREFSGTVSCEVQIQCRTIPPPPARVF